MSRHTVPLFRVLLFLLLVAAAPVGAQDCNSNGTDDATDIAVGTSYDCNLNGIPDECDIANSIDPDSTDPVISGVPANISQTNDAGNCSASVTWTEPTATDNCQIQNFISTHSPGATFQVGTTTVTYVATDVHGNSATATFTVTVTDDEGPVINLP
ncbi:MAG: HYR domain-containing protein, partial [Planctomycetota bacterium]